jgi:hypothetical protein
VTNSAKPYHFQWLAVIGVMFFNVLFAATLNTRLFKELASSLVHIGIRSGIGALLGLRRHI